MNAAPVSVIHGGSGSLPIAPAPDLEQLVALTLRYLDRGHGAAFVATALGVSLAFVTRVEVGAALVRLGRRP